MLPPFFRSALALSDATAGHIRQLTNRLVLRIDFFQRNNPRLAGVMFRAAQELPHAVLRIMGDTENRSTVQDVTASDDRRSRRLPEWKAP